MPLVPVICVRCDGRAEVDGNVKTAVCEYCNHTFIVEDTTINNYNITYESSQSADRMTEIAEAFMNLQKYDNAMEVFQEMQKKHPDDYRGWWGDARIISAEFTVLKLSHEHYSGILNNIRNAIGVSRDMSWILQNQLDKYVSAVYQTMLKLEERELQSKKTSFQKELEDKQSEQKNSQHAFSEAERGHGRVQQNYILTQRRLADAKKAPRIVGVVLYTLLGLWAIFLLFIGMLEGILPFLLMVIVGIPIFVILPGIGIGFIVTAMSSKAKRLAAEVEAISKYNNAYGVAKAKYEDIYKHIKGLEINIKKYDDALSELSKEQDQKFKESYISGTIKHLM